MTRLPQPRALESATSVLSKDPYSGSFWECLRWLEKAESDDDDDDDDSDEEPQVLSIFRNPELSLHKGPDMSRASCFFLSGACNSVFLEE